ncbi:sensor histidine kinase [Streptacidiphilus fuscans]|uniref:histidine kinase n=1 Tax=Streptacidiphilus fuscans TaxID=2789292 RepID=A0A931BAI5_9ACTN|nr:sensor histidine kinase [Streptacidiphilus fuscans]MBF9071667.1 nitrate- and nitrite sensing domain-containing protein [Streptacidiphilus fuscans]
MTSAPPSSPGSPKSPRTPKNSTAHDARGDAGARRTRPRPAHAGRPADEGLGAAHHPSGYRSRPLTGAHPLNLSVRLRPRTVRARIISLLMVPVVSLLALWAFATVTTAQSVDALIQLKQVDQTLLAPIGATVDAVQAERTAGLAYLAAPSGDRLATYQGRQHLTDMAVASMNQDVLLGENAASGLSATLVSRIGTLDTATASLQQLRNRVTGRQLSWPDASTSYTGVIDSGFGVVGSLSSVTGQITGTQNGSAASDARVLLELSQAREMLTREDAAVQAAQAQGRMTSDQYQEFVGARYARQTLTQSAAPDLAAADDAAFQQVTGGQQAVALAQLEAAVQASGGGTRAAQAAGAGWTATATGVEQQLDTVLTQARQTATGAQNDPYLGLLSTNGLAVLLGLAAVSLSLLISVRIGRGLVIELVGLRNSALELAGRRLPDAMRRLRAGEELDIESEAPVIEPGDDEIGQVGEALNTVQRAALTAAVERAEVLSGVSGVFVNLARRSQVLVHRQLTLLDAMERRTEDPSELEDLFRLDHLTTRMRRHAEGLIILSGATPGRAWRKPIPLLDVVRSAVAEVEDYARVDVRSLPGVSVVGAAVADLTHLLAELVENATAFSPPHTRVQVTGEQVGTGYAVEIEDRGLGMGKDAVGDANRKIADAQQADLFDSDRLGLFVVSRLARRHGVRVSLRPSAYGGTTAVVLLPNALLETGRGRQRDAGGAGIVTAPPIDAELDLPPLTAPPTRPGTTGSVASAQAGGGLPTRPSTRPSAQRRPSPSAQAAPNGPRSQEPMHRQIPPDNPQIVPDRADPDRADPQRPEPERPEPERRGPDRLVTEQAVPAPTPLRRNGDELPRRVRQASLAVQLREAPTETHRAPGRSGGTPERSPEQARETMSALREGWTRGRRSSANGPATNGPTRHLKIQEPDFERKAADGRDDQSDSHR